MYNKNSTNIYKWKDQFIEENFYKISIKNINKIMNEFIIILNFIVKIVIIYLENYEKEIKKLKIYIYLLLMKLIKKYF